jgi:hypothetical protein
MENTPLTRQPFGVIILNWNGALDTIDCVRSIYATHKTAIPIIVDNGSTDDSLIKIKEAILSDGKSIISGNFEEVFMMLNAIKKADAVIIDAKENLGFAKGCNLGLKIASAASIHICVFLNNDTIVENDALYKLVDKLEKSLEIYVTLPMITIYKTSLIWNCGGRISKFGFRRYNYPNIELSSVNLKKEIVCTFFTGCCFAIRTADFMARNGFTERFFFGEEDFELSLWMMDHGLHSLCITDAIVHHKVGTSISRAAGSLQSSKIFVHYLNRFIHMRLRFGTIRWVFWLLLYLPYVVFLLLYKKIITFRELPRFTIRLLSMSKSKNHVSRHDFESIIRSRPW